MSRKTIGWLALGVMLFGWTTTAQAEQEDPPYECDNQFGACGTPNQSGGGGGGGGGSILVNNTDLGDTYQTADDYDNDGMEDPQDNCPRTPNIDQGDSDGDGFGDACDNCLGKPNKDQSDIDGDEIGDICDSDKDGDEIANAKDNCAGVPNPVPSDLKSQPDQDGDGVGDACDEDIDGDGMDNLEDPCPANKKSVDPGSSDVTCFPDKDGDETPDLDDVCPGLYNPDQADMDDDGLGDMCDPDIEGDGIQNVRDNCPMTANPKQLDSDRDGPERAGTDLDVGGDACDASFCFVVLGDTANCLDPKAPLKAYSPKLKADTGQTFRLRLYANRRNQPMRFHWKLKSAPEGSQALVDGRKGTVTISTPFEYRYIEDKLPTFTPDKPGEYVFQVDATTVWDDRVSGKVEETASYTTTVTAEGEPVTLHRQAGGCSVGGDERPAGGAFWLAAFGLGGLLLRRRG